MPYLLVKFFDDTDNETLQEFIKDRSEYRAVENVKVYEAAAEQGVQRTAGSLAKFRGLAQPANQ